MATSHKISRIGILTGGGDAPGLNAVIRAVVKAAAHVHGWETIGIEDGFEGLVTDAPHRTLSADDVRGLLPRGGTILGSSNKGRFTGGLGRPGIPPEVLDEAVRNGHLGVSQSIRGRVHGLGGRIELVTAPGEGTEWEITIEKPGRRPASG